MDLVLDAELGAALQQIHALSAGVEHLRPMRHVAITNIECLMLLKTIAHTVQYGDYMVSSEITVVP